MIDRLNAQPIFKFLNKIASIFVPVSDGCNNDDNNIINNNNNFNFKSNNNNFNIVENDNLGT